MPEKVVQRTTEIVQITEEDITPSDPEADLLQAMEREKLCACGCGQPANDIHLIPEFKRLINLPAPEKTPMQILKAWVNLAYHMFDTGKAKKIRRQLEYKKYGCVMGEAVKLAGDGALFGNDTGAALEWIADKVRGTDDRDTMRTINALPRYFDAGSDERIKAWARDPVDRSILDHHYDQFGEAMGGYRTVSHVQFGRQASQLMNQAVEHYME